MKKLAILLFIIALPVFAGENKPNVNPEIKPPPFIDPNKARQEMEDRKFWREYGDALYTLGVIGLAPTTAFMIDEFLLESYFMGGVGQHVRNAMTLAGTISSGLVAMGCYLSFKYRKRGFRYGDSSPEGGLGARE